MTETVVTWPRMLASLPVEAFRRDYQRNSDRTSLEGVGALWLALSTTLTRAATAPREARGLLRSLGRARISSTFPTVTAQLLARLADAPTDMALLRRLITQMEDTGALALADTALGAASELPWCDELERGRMLAQRGRVARHLGRLDLAEDRYRSVDLLARRTRSSELGARARIGYAVLALVRGNIPSSERWFRLAVRLADASEVSDVRILAHHGCLVAAAKRGDFGRALVHGWRAVIAADGDPALEAEMLLNLSAVVLDTGNARAASAGFEAVLRRTRVPRVVLPALAGGALAHAMIGESTRARALLARLERAGAANVLPFPIADALLTATRAWHVLGDEDASARSRAHGLLLARAHGFHEITFMLEATERETVEPASVSSATPQTHTDAPPVRRGASIAPARSVDTVRLDRRARAVCQALLELPRAG